MGTIWGFARCFSHGSFSSEHKPQIVPIPLHLDLGHVNRMRHAAEGRHGVGAHDLRRNEEVNAVHQPARQQSRIQPRAGLGQQRQNALLAQYIQHLTKRNAASLGSQNLHAHAALVLIRRSAPRPLKQ